jgi:serine/threonine-protein kinase
MQLSHGNVVQVFDFGEVDGQYFLAMEHVDGLTLNQLLKAAKRGGLTGVPAPIAVIVGIELCKALQYAHSKADAQGKRLQVVHRDLSPDNVLISFEGQVKLSDFGIARAVMEGRERTSPDVFRGRLDYCAPEQAQALPVDARSDLYSVGVVLMTVVLGQNPVAARALQIAAGAERFPEFSDSVVDPTFARIVNRCTARAPAERYQTARELHEALQAWLTMNDAAAAVRALPNFLAMLRPVEVRQRGLTVREDQAFVAWVERWQAGKGRVRAAFDDPTEKEGRALPLPTVVTPPAPRALDAAAAEVERPRSEAPPRAVLIAGALVLAVTAVVVGRSVMEAPPPEPPTAAPPPERIVLPAPVRAVAPVPALPAASVKDAGR